MTTPAKFCKIQSHISITVIIIHSPGKEHTAHTHTFLKDNERDVRFRASDAKRRRGKGADGALLYFLALRVAETLAAYTAGR